MSITHIIALVKVLWESSGEARYGRSDVNDETENVPCEPQHTMRTLHGLDRPSAKCPDTEHGLRDSARPPTPGRLRLDQPYVVLGGLPEIAGPSLVEPRDAKLRAALDQVFANPGRRPQGWVKAVVVVHDGHVIAERYASGYGVDTPLVGWSATKSVTNALIGILVRQGKLAVDQPAPVSDWSGPHDPRHAITVDRLLRMTSGLAVKETNSGFDPESRMLYLERDMAGFAERAGIRGTPGSRWDYTSANTLILSRIIRASCGTLRVKRRYILIKRNIGGPLRGSAARSAGRLAFS